MIDPDLLHPDRWTSGAQRALRRAAQAAAYHPATEIWPLHLLWALLRDEGRAGSQLEELGATNSVLQPYHERLAQADLEEVSHLPEIAEWADAAVDILRESRHIARHQSGSSEVGTDHLLAAFLSTRHELNSALAPFQQDSPETSASPLMTTEEMGDELTEAAIIPALRVDLALRERQPPNLVELYRILDAAANRLREGLRVAEDFARFGRNDSWLSQELKGVRHALTGCLQDLPQAQLLASRDTLGDVGTTLEGSQEYQRTDVTDVLSAAFKRVQEAARTLEEFSKVISGDLGRRFEKLRYRVYTLEKAVLTTHHNRERLHDQRLYLLLSDDCCPAGVPFVLNAALEAGVRLFQVREKSLTDRALLEHCRRIRRWTRERGASLIINDRPDIAVLCEADGVHVGQDELSVADTRRIVGPERWIGVSTHNIAQARQAVLDGADYLGVGPTFPSQTKSFGEFPGLQFVQQVAAEIDLPWFAIGGIDDTNLATVLQAGATRVAVTRAVSSTPHPLESAANLLSILGGRKV